MPKKISELQSAELKFRALLNKRDEINEQAFVLRSERDTLNNQKRDLQDRARGLRDKRNALVTEMRVHKARRGELQKRAKELIEFKRSKKGTPTSDLKGEIRTKATQVKNLDMRQQTVPMSIPDERELLDEIKDTMKELEKLKGILKEQEKLQKEVRNMDASIDTLFKQADKEHEEVVRLAKESQKYHDEFAAAMAEIDALSASADKKHAEFVKLKEDADAVHQKAMEMREKVIEIKGQKRAERKAERDAIREVNTATRMALDDKHKKDKAAEDALQTLLKKGKVQI